MLWYTSHACALLNAAITTSWAAFAYVTVICFATRKCYGLHLPCSFLKQPTYPPLLPSSSFFSTLLLFCHIMLAPIAVHALRSLCCASSLNINTIRGAGLAQFYRLQLARLINLQRIAHSDYTVTLPPSIPTRGLLVHCLLSQSQSHLTPLYIHEGATSALFTLLMHLTPLCLRSRSQHESSYPAASLCVVCGT